MEFSSVISDFFQNVPHNHNKNNHHSSKNPLFKSLQTTGNHHDLICVTLTDPREHSMPPIGILTLEDAESGEQIVINTNSKKVRKRYESENKKRILALEDSFKKIAIDNLIISTEGSYVDPLRKFLMKRLRNRYH